MRVTVFLTKSCLISTLLLLASAPAFFSAAQDRAQRSNRPCPAAIKYRIGTLDPRFGITGEEFRRLIEQAGNVWEANRKFFHYDPRGRLRISLVYDTRQEFTQHVTAVRASVSAKMVQADAIKEKLLPFQQNFRTLDVSYSEDAASFERAQDSYNQDVKRSNLAGGSTESRLQELASQRQSLRKQFDALEEKRQALNQAADELNALIEKRNRLLKLGNAEADAVNNAGPASVKFEEGRYVREGAEERIDIFQFESKDKLLVILAHELGHALGMKHNANPASIMSPLIQTDRLALTVEDEDGLKAACSPR